MTPDVQENIGYAARPWTFHLFRLSKWSPLLTGIAFGGLVLALMTMLEFATGRPQAVLDGKSLADAGCVYLIGDYRIGIISIMMLTYAMTARYILAGWTRRTAAHLGRADFVDSVTGISSDYGTNLKLRRSRPLWRLSLGSDQRVPEAKKTGSV
jgi:hypothetical protein